MAGPSPIAIGPGPIVIGLGPANVRFLFNDRGEIETIFFSSDKNNDARAINHTNIPKDSLIPLMKPVVNATFGSNQWTQKYLQAFQW